MEKLTLAQWVRDNRKTLRFDHEERRFACECTNAQGRHDLRRIEDFKVIGGRNHTFFFHGHYLKTTVATKEDFLALSYFTLCGVSDAMMVASVDGMVYSVSRDGDYHGLLYTDMLGNFLAIE